VKRLRLAIVGFGRLGRACAEAAVLAHDLELAGVVVRRAPALRAAAVDRGQGASRQLRLFSCSPACRPHRVVEFRGAGR